jgi:hypothetical protein
MPIQVAAVIDEWRAGHHSLVHFTANLYTDVYNNHIGILDRIEKENSQAFAVLMRVLYLAASWV